ncbi:hypothetical protein BT96DRAFT_953456 [Gymnopus androsaceus JB14]|uniref:DNA 3'-5' helicase n=1 Tax=Gymnopus androsaceus JB14 TaxID=1447944 RepID=A0A6A4IGC4_9AGAR|nr:hypothetical protein BT96DRAFT_953456 [Gymnopus androsaceus JB14]
MLCDVFNIEELREHQDHAGKNILRGMSTIYNLPTGGGKTFAFWYALFYHWDTKSDALISALAVNSERDKMEDIFENTPGEDDCLKHQVVFVSPETALLNSFHEQVLRNKTFRNNCNDFRTEYGQPGKLLVRLPSGLPVLFASATMPEEVIKDILFKVGLIPECERVAVSNAKYNVVLSIRVLQHPTTTYADLFSLFPTGENEGFPQTIIYMNSRTEVKQIQDFLHRHQPSHMPEDVFEFYHWNITKTRKEYIQKGLQSGKL